MVKSIQNQEDNNVILDRKIIFLNFTRNGNTPSGTQEAVRSKKFSLETKTREHLHGKIQL